MASHSDKRPGHKHLEAGHASHCAVVPNSGRGRCGKGSGLMPGCQTPRVGLGLRGKAVMWGEREHPGWSFFNHTLFPWPGVFLRAVLLCPLVKQMEISLGGA